MEPPPSYPQATTQDHWSIISSFVASRDLCSAALVCRRWSIVFMSQLWGNPASHFGTENDAVYVALVRFKRTLSWARMSTRELTHTLILPPAHAEIYDGPRADWLEKILTRLPRLQSLIVSGLPFFDHWALLGLRSKTRSDGPEEPPSIATYGLRLLEASACFNTTSLGLSQSLKHFPSLVYLDLSRTLPARDISVLQALHNLPALQILKLRGLGLKDEDAQTLCKSIGLRVRSLDVRDNRFTDDAVRMILQECITTSSIARTIERNRMIQSHGIPYMMQDFFGFDLPSVYRTNGQDIFIKSGLTSGFCNLLGIEDASQTGITHLYISGNNISIHAVADLLRIQRLHVLDVGTPIGLHKTEFHKMTSPSYLTGGSEALVPLLEQNGNELTYLRLNHSVVTKFTSTVDSNVAELEAELPEHAQPDIPLSNEHPVELEGDYLPIQELPAEPVFELDGVPLTKPPISNLPQNTSNSQPCTEISELQTSISEPQTSISVPQTSISDPQTSISAPEISGPPSNGLLNPLSISRPSGIRTTSYMAPEPISIPPLVSPPLVSPNDSSTPTITVSSTEETLMQNGNKKRERSYSGILADHDARVQYQKSQPHGLLPSMMPALRTLVLTNVPTHSTTNHISQMIISFIRRCAEEAHWSQMQSQVSYALPPGHTGESAERTYAKSLFALRRLILEMSPYSATDDSTKSPPRSPRRVGKSSVEDADCETFWAAAVDDFTFFGNEEEECGVHGSDMRPAIPLEARLGKMLVGDDSMPVRYSPSRLSNGSIRNSDMKGPLVDTLAEISKFRSEKRVLHQIALQRGEVDRVVDGHWEGEIVVMRNA